MAEIDHRYNLFHKHGIHIMYAVTRDDENKVEFRWIIVCLKKLAVAYMLN